MWSRGLLEPMIGCSQIAVIAFWAGVVSHTLNSVSPLEFHVKLTLVNVPYTQGSTCYRDDHIQDELI